MFKKIIIGLLLIVSSFLIFSNSWFTNEWESKDWEAKKRCLKNWESMINCPQFTIKTETFSPGWGGTLSKAKAWWWKTEETANILLWEIIRNLIVVFWVLSLFVITIGWGYMIFHSWEESLLTRWKTMLKYWVISLVIALSSWIMVKLVTWLLY